MTINELKQALARAGYNFTDSEIARFVASIDLNNDGKVSFPGKYLQFFSD